MLPIYDDTQLVQLGMLTMMVSSDYPILLADLRYLLVDVQIRPDEYEQAKP